LWRKLTAPEPTLQRAPLAKACVHIASQDRGTSNYPFNAGPEGQGFKNLLFPFPALRNQLRILGFELATKDIHAPEDSSLLIAWDDPHAVSGRKAEGALWCLVIQEPPVYAPETWDRTWHEQFDIVFTYDRSQVDDQKYFYYRLPADTEFFSLPPVIDERTYGARTLAVTVSNAIQRHANPIHPNCTHADRYRTIRWYGKNHPGDFGFFSGTFEQRNFFLELRGGVLLRRALGQRAFRTMAAVLQRDLRRVFKGELTPLGKFDAVRAYNFYYCYENTTHIPGYVSEKLFDCFYSGVVPIYWGAPDVSDLIPYRCYIDGSAFQNADDLYWYLKRMPYDEYASYLQEARRFLTSNDLEPFTVAAFVDSITAPIQSRL
jgi:hypothetical protein